MIEMPRFDAKSTYFRAENSSQQVSKEMLLERIADKSLFNSERDISIAKDILQRLCTRREEGRISEPRYLACLDSLDTLIPKRNEKNWRVIGGISISPVMESTIKSRLTSKEMDVAGKGGSWGSLHPDVKTEIASVANMIIEMTGTCTVKCSFCALSEKGPIERKISFSSLEKILKFYRNNQKIPSYQHKSDALYWGTDPFDAKWENEKGEELDYSDVAQMYWRIMKGKQRFLYSSTAMPIGEELRILNFADMFLDKKEKEEINSLNNFRISRTNVNEKRVDAIKCILESLHGTLVPSDIDLSNNRNNNESKAGKKWDEDFDSLSTWDVVGPNCRDGVIVGVDAVTAVVMEASSNERPRGESRFSIVQKSSDGSVEYTIPHHRESPNSGDRAETYYLDTDVTKIKIDKNKSVREVQTITDNPHRAFLRMVYAYSTYKGDENIENSDRDDFQKRYQSEIDLVNIYLNSGSSNKAMTRFMSHFRDIKLIK